MPFPTATWSAAVGIGVFGASGNTIGGTNAGAGNVISGKSATWASMLRGSSVSRTIDSGKLHRPERHRHECAAEHRRRLYGGHRLKLQHSSAAPAPGRAMSFPATSLRMAFIISGPGTSGNFVLGQLRRHGRHRHQRGRQWEHRCRHFVCRRRELTSAARAGAGNLISGNSSYGVAIIGASDNVVQGNYVGTDVTGKKALANGFADDGIGLWRLGEQSDRRHQSRRGQCHFRKQPLWRLHFRSRHQRQCRRGKFHRPRPTGTNAIGNNGFGVGIFEQRDRQHHRRRERRGGAISFPAIPVSVTASPSAARAAIWFRAISSAPTSAAPMRSANGFANIGIYSGCDRQHHRRHRRGRGQRDRLRRQARRGFV